MGNTEESFKVNNQGQQILLSFRSKRRLAVS